MNKKLLVRILILLVGLTIAHLGVTLFLIADLGSDPFNVLVQGLLHVMQKTPLEPVLTHGRLHMAICFLIILVLLVVDRSYIKIGTIICMFCGGPIIDFFNMILGKPLGSIQSLPGKIVMLALGCVILAYGMTMVIKSEAGTGPNDLVAVVISDKMHRKFSVVRILTDGAFVLLGFLLGGTVGIGTVICAFLVGPVAGVFLPVNERLVAGIMKKVS